MCTMIYIINDAGMRLCQDNKWRSFANFGTFPECVKVYRRLCAAETKANKIKGKVVQLSAGMEVDAVGKISTTEE